jgi:ACS family hexuronate transporter-like MFS transporter
MARETINAVGRYRWTICALVFFATTINYLDRQVLSLVKQDLDQAFGWNKTDYANITVAFQLAYAIGMIWAGWWIDKLGTKKGYALSLVGWSLSAIAHAFVGSTGGFMVTRAALGVTESGNFPAAIRAITEYFPRRERAFATGIFNSGTNIGAVIAPLTVPFIAAAFGWRMAFVVTGATGFIWLFFWYRFYEIPARQKRLSKAEFDYIHADGDEEPASPSGQALKISWARLLQYRQTWAFTVGKFLTDGVWWFYLFWLPDFLFEQYGLGKTAIALPIAYVYTVAGFGSVFGGWLPMYLMKKGWPVFRARKRSMFLYAVSVLPVLAAQYLGAVHMWYAVVIIGFATASHQAWSANIFTTVSDMFPKFTVGAVVGIGGFAGGLGAIMTSKAAGYLFDYFKAKGHIETGYWILFIYCALAYLLAWLIMHLLVPRMKQVQV